MRRRYERDRRDVGKEDDAVGVGEGWEKSKWGCDVWMIYIVTFVCNALMLIFVSLLLTECSTVL